MENRCSRCGCQARRTTRVPPGSDGVVVCMFCHVNRPAEGGMHRMERVVWTAASAVANHLEFVLSRGVLLRGDEGELP